MRNFCRLAATSVFALSVVACGAPAQEDEAASAVAEESADAETATVEETTGDAATAASEVAAPEDEASQQVAAPSAPPAAFTQCQVCHQTAPGQNGIGPSLAGVFGRKAAQVSNFSYTAGMRSSGLTWNEAALDRYLANPSAEVPGTTMAVGSLSDTERAEIIAYLKTL
jgi:cytochrome c2